MEAMIASNPFEPTYYIELINILREFPGEAETIKDWRKAAAAACNMQEEFWLQWIQETISSCISSEQSSSDTQDLFDQALLSCPSVHILLAYIQYCSDRFDDELMVS